MALQSLTMVTGSVITSSMGTGFVATSSVTSNSMATVYVATSSVVNGSVGSAHGHWPNMIFSHYLGCKDIRSCHVMSHQHTGPRPRPAKLEWVKPGRFTRKTR